MQGRREGSAEGGRRPGGRLVDRWYWLHTTPCRPSRGSPRGLPGNGEWLGLQTRLWAGQSPGISFLGLRCCWKKRFKTRTTERLTRHCLSHCRRFRKALSERGLSSNGGTPRKGHLCCCWQVLEDPSGDKGRRQSTGFLLNACQARMRWEHRQAPKRLPRQKEISLFHTAKHRQCMTCTSGHRTVPCVTQGSSSLHPVTGAMVCVS